MPPAPKDLAERIAVLETTVDLGFRHIGERLDKIVEDLSDAGKTPKPVDRATPAGIRLPMPDTMLGYAKVLAVYLPLLGTAYAILSSGTQSAATSAIEAAVEDGRAVPIAAPVVRVVPVPVPVPVPVEPEPPPVPDDLMPLGEQ